MQVLRAVAAIAVVTVHIPIPLGNGSWGVDLFFVISGFIMCYVTEYSGDRFFAKRVIRIVPIYWAGSIGVFGVALIAPSLLQNTTPDVVHLVKSLLFIPFRKQELVQPILFLGWTLNYEMFFYSLFAVSMKASHRYRVLISSALIVAIVICGQLLNVSKSILIKFWASPITLEFVFGMICFSIFKKVAKQPTQQPLNSSRIFGILAGGVLIITMSLVSVFKLSEIRVVNQGILAALTLYVFLFGLSGVRFPKSIVLIGDASFSLYLFHPYIINAFEKIFHVFGAGAVNVYSYFLAIVVVSLCCGLAVISYKFFERPITNNLRAKFVDNHETKRDSYKVQVPRG